ncbi:MAG: carbon storage regulator CsrA [Defluviitaleaceae bacterium]|nr:carbon storage regulator CsrA [Defluviitaleaceae bacterium]
MLALTRKKGESIIISDNIEIVVISIKGEQVKLGINAPRSIPVNRKEIYELIVASNKESASNFNLSAFKDLNSDLKKKDKSD